MASRDIMKAFNIISHACLLKELYRAGFPRRWWILKEDSYTNMGSKVIWNGQLDERFTVMQGNGQGWIARPGDLKEYTDVHIGTIKAMGHGTHIGSTFKGMLACANDVLLTCCWLHSRHADTVRTDKLLTSYKATPRDKCIHLWHNTVWTGAPSIQADIENKW